MKRYYVYMLLCRDDSFYVGVTSDPEQRLGRHNSGWYRGCYTFTRRPLKLVYISDFANGDDAIRWEKQLKGWSRKKKAALVRGDWNAIRALAHGSP